MELICSKYKVGESNAMCFWQFNVKGPAFQFLAFFNLVLCCLFLFNSTAIPQTIKGSYSFERSQDQVKTLLNLLSNDSTLEKIPKCFFGENVAYDAELVDLLVFIDKRGRHTNASLEKSNTSELPCLKKDNFTRFAVIKGEKKREELFGAKFIYVMVFVAENDNEQNSVGRFTKDIETMEKVVENPVGNASRKTEEKDTEKLVGGASGKTRDTSIEKSVVETSGKTDEVTKTIKYREPLSVSQSSLDSRASSGEFILYSAIKSIGKAFSSVAIEKSERTPDIVNVPLRMFLVGSDNAKTNLYFGFMKTALFENTINRFTIQEDYGNNEDPHQNKKNMHLATFGNYSSSYITSSIGLMFTRQKAEVQNNEKDNRYLVDPFVFAHLYLKRPQLPGPRFQNSPAKKSWKEFSFSFVVGTKISDPLFEDLFTGICVGQIFGVSSVVGVNWRTTTEANDGEKIKKRKPRFTIGVAFVI